MSSPVIKVENLSKQYRLGQVGTGSLSHDINRLWHRARGKEDPYLKIGEENNREAKGNSDYVWALKDINFDIQQGDRVGIIGRNGAGKSTLLKILSRTTSPTGGSVKIKGRVASLLEVGTGFHPDLSGRDNIYLNGAILGMSKRDITSRFDEIVDFAGVERYIDTPVKRYSSGMYVRLAFAVAAHLESDILIVDEVLAVGDAEFQKKCLGKMGEVSEGEGRTILFVSHNMGGIQNLCKRTIYLINGSVESFGNTPSVIDHYLSNNVEKKSAVVSMPIVNKAIQIEEISFKNAQRGSLNFYFDEKINIYISLKIREPVSGACIDIACLNKFENRVFTIREPIKFKRAVKENVKLLFEIPATFLTPGLYKMSFIIHVPNMSIIDEYHEIPISIHDNGFEYTLNNGVHIGDIYFKSKPIYL